MTQHLLETFGIFGGSVVIAFVAGLFPIVSIEVFLGIVSRLSTSTFSVLTACVLLAAFGHQIAKTMTYFAGVGALERGPIARRLERAKPRLERWKRQKWLVMVLASTFGLPPLYLIGFIAHPLLDIRFVPYTAIGFLGRVARFAVIIIVVRLF